MTKGEMLLNYARERVLACVAGEAMMGEDLRVVCHLSSDQFHDPDDCPCHADDGHVYYAALRRGEAVAGTSYEELREAVEQDDLDPYRRNFFILSRPEPDARKRLAALLVWFGCGA